MIQMRTLSVILALSTSAFCFAQTANAALEEALGQLRSSSGIALILAGQESAGGKRSDIRVNAYAVLSGTKIRTELWSYRGRELSALSVADGDYLWRYSPKINQYEAIAYGREADPVKALLSRLPLIHTQTEGIPIRLLDNIFQVQRTNKPVLDVWQPMGQVQEEGGETELTVTSSLGAQSYIFELKREDETSPWQLMRIEGSLAQPSRRLDWSMEVMAGFVPAETTFTFVPPKGSKAAAGSVSSKISRQ